MSCQVLPFSECWITQLPFSCFTWPSAKRLLTHSMPFFCCCRCVTIARSPPQRPMEVHHAQPKRPSRSPVRTPPLAPSNPSSSPSTASALGQPPPAPASAPVKATAHKHPPTPSPPLRRMVVLLVMLQTVPQSPSHAGNALATLKSFRAHQTEFRFGS